MTAPTCFCGPPLPTDDTQACPNCGRCRICLVDPAVAKGRCRTCYQYLRRNGHDRPVDLIANAPWHQAARDTPT